jgi:hypothetical protein
VGGNAALAAGFVISGGPQMVLVRGVAGATLADFGVGGVLANPRLELYRETTLIATNEDWAGGATAVATLRALFTRVGAFPIDPSTRDAVLLAILEPGSYSARVTPGDPGSGVALVELYEVPSAGP